MGVEGARILSRTAIRLEGNVPVLLLHLVDVADHIGNCTVDIHRVLLLFLLVYGDHVDRPVAMDAVTPRAGLTLLGALLQLEYLLAELFKLLLLDLEASQLLLLLAYGHPLPQPGSGQHRQVIEEAVRVVDAGLGLAWLLDDGGRVVHSEDVVHGVEVGDDADVELGICALLLDPHGQVEKRLHPLGIGVGPGLSALEADRTCEHVAEDVVLRRSDHDAGPHFVLHWDPRGLLPDLLQEFLSADWRTRCWDEEALSEEGLMEVLLLPDLLACELL